MATLAQLRAAVKGYLTRDETAGADATLDQNSEATLDRAINVCLRYVCRTTKCNPTRPMVMTITAGKALYDLTSCEPAVDELYMLRYASGSGVDPVDLFPVYGALDYPDQWPQTTNTAAGTPTGYFLSGDGLQLQLIPTPVVTVVGGLVVLARFEPTLLVNGTDTDVNVPRTAYDLAAMRAALLLNGTLMAEDDYSGVRGGGALLGMYREGLDEYQLKCAKANEGAPYRVAPGVQRVSPLYYTPGGRY